MVVANGRTWRRKRHSLVIGLEWITETFPFLSLLPFASGAFPEEDDDDKYAMQQPIMKL